MAAAALVIIVVVVVMLMLVVVAAAAFVIIVVVMVMLMLVVVAAAALVPLVVVMGMLMLVVVAAAALVIIVVVVVMLMLMVVTAAALVIIVVVVVMLVVVLHDLLGTQQARRALNHVQHLRGGQLVPGGGDDAGMLVVAAQQLHAFFNALPGRGLGAAEDDGFRVFDLINEELAEILGVHAALAHVRDGGAALEGNLVFLHQIQHHAADIGELAHAGGLDDDAVGMIGIHQLVQRAAEVAHQRAADAAGIQLGDLDAGIAHEAAVHADLAVFIFQQHDLFVSKGAAQELLDQRRLAGAQKTGNNIDLRHFVSPVLNCFFLIIIACECAFVTHGRQISSNNNIPPTDAAADVPDQRRQRNAGQRPAAVDQNVPKFTAAARLKGLMVFVQGCHSHAQGAGQRGALRAAPAQRGHQRPREQRALHRKDAEVRRLAHDGVKDVQRPGQPREDPHQQARNHQAQPAGIHARLPREEKQHRNPCDCGQPQQLCRRRAPFFIHSSAPSEKHRLPVVSL